MQLIHVAKRFNLNHGGKMTEYLPGRYEVEDVIAEHWYVQAHLEGFVEPPPRTGTEQQAVLFAQQAARLNEPVDAQGQKPGVAPPEAEKAPAPEIRFAGRRPPRSPDPDMASFIDPSSRGAGA